MMQVVRIAILCIDPMPDELAKFELIIGNVTIALHTTTEDGESPEKSTRVIAMATVKLPEMLEVDEHNRLLVPENIRETCEEAIEQLADLLSVFYGASRSVASATPCLALIPENPKEALFLKESSGIRPTQRKDFAVRQLVPFEPEYLAATKDRLDGVALIAEAFSSKSDSGVYRDLVRFFELAFALPFTQLEKKLGQFLSGISLGYTRQEVRSWIDIRHPITHADMRKTTSIAYTKDVMGYVSRMRQAATDVLMNKEHWKNKSSCRRRIWVPDAASTSVDGNIVVRQGSAPTFQFRLYDEFGVYPRDLKGILTAPPEGWYYEFAEPGGHSEAVET